MTVTVRVVFLKIGEIETVKECFSAEAFIQAKWREPALDAVVNDPVIITLHYLDYTVMTTFDTSFIAWGNL